MIWLAANWKYIVIGWLAIFLLLTLWRIDRQGNTISDLNKSLDLKNEQILASEAARIAERNAAKQTADEIIRQRDRAVADKEAAEGMADKIRQRAKERPQDATEVPQLLFDTAHGSLR